MHDGTDIMAGKRLCKPVGIENGGPNKERPASSHYFNAVDHIGRTVAQIVENKDIMASPQERDAGMGADEP
jgi:hypothetical protein